ncbi:hypothetical protein ADT27_13365 [Xanthomonas oryzae]|uniref:hypothetical protein n=1 Tax=Xanthomonas oryzae TaxID=347 RepID=UPI0006AC7CC5|nr:hypothetical protein [Xanthomonas oryzae]KOR44981.1 hypothetical protein ADT27_13365 [Xanthomonas oryzae]
MAIVNIDIDTVQPNGKLGDPARTAFSKVNANFADVQGQITAEVSARQSAVSSVQTTLATKAASSDLAAEISARQSAVSSVQTTLATKAASSDLAAEISARQSADTSISATVTAQGQAINQRALSTDLSSEIASRQAADTALGARIDGVTAMTGRNRLLNPGFSRVSRGASGSFSNSSAETYTADQWICGGLSMSGNWGRGQLTGTGNTFAEGRNYFAFNVTSANLAWLGQKIEGVNTLSGGKATLSVWLRSTVAGKRLGVRIVQSFGTGGSPSAAVETVVTSTPLTLSTTFQKFTLVFDVPSVSGKTLGTNNNDYLYLVFDIAGSGYGNALSGQTGQIEFAFPQLEKGSVATDFEARSPGLEKSLCEWYLKAGFIALRGNGQGNAGTGTFIAHEMRAAPAITFQNTSYAYNCSGISYAAYASGSEVFVNATGVYAFSSNYIMSAEL